MRIRMFLTLLLALFVFGLASCDYFNLPEEQISVSGAAVKGPVRNGTVTAYQLNSDGSRGEAIATAATGDDGGFELKISKEFANSAEIVVTEGTYVDEATGETVSMGTYEMAACVGALEENGSVAVTPVTTMARERMRSRAGDGSGKPIQEIIAESNVEIAEAFGLGEVDITEVIPADMSDDAAQTRTQAQQQYGAVLAGLCQAIREQNRDADEVLDLVEDLADDLEDGEIDGVDGDGEAIATESESDPGIQNTYQNMNQYIYEFMNGPRNKSGKAAGDSLVTVPETDEENAEEGDTETTEGSGSETAQEGGSGIGQEV